MKLSPFPLAHSLCPLLAGISVCITCATPLTAKTTPPAQTSAVESPEAAQLRTQYVKIQAQLESVQRKASDSPAVKEEQSRLEAVVRRAMVREEPKVAALLESQDKLVAELSGSRELNLPAAERSEGFQTKYISYMEQRDKIQTVAAKVSERPEVISSQQQYRGVLAEEMTRVEPEVPRLIEERDNIAARYKQLAEGNR